MISKLTPNLIVPEVANARAFYESLGFTTVTTVPQEGPPEFAILVCNGVELMLQSKANVGEDLPSLADREVGEAAVLYMEVDNIDTLEAELDGRAETVVPMRTTFYGMREFYITDPNGYVIGFAQRLEE